MTSLYTSTVKLVASFVGDAKAGGIVERQLKHCGATPESLAAKDLKQIVSRIHAASGLYLPDVRKKAELLGKLEALAA